MAALVDNNIAETAAQAAGGLVVAARGWRHPAWRTDYYPEDLPQDWQLAFYSNEFRAVVVPAEYWSTVDAVEIVRWQEDTDDDFRFFLEVTDLRTGWEAFSALVSPLAGQIGGVLLHPTHCDADLSQLELSLQRARQLGPVAVILPPGLDVSPLGRQLLDDANVNLHWPVGEGQPRWSAGPLALATANGLARTPREWRTVVEHCLSFGVDSDDVVLMMAGEGAPDVETLRVTTVIADLLAPASEGRR